MKTKFVLETILATYEEFEKSADKIGKDKNSLKDFMDIIKIYVKTIDRVEELEPNPNQST